MDAPRTREEAIAQAVEEGVAALANPDIRARRATFGDLYDRKYPDTVSDWAPLIPVLIRALEDPDRFVRDSVADVLARFGEHAAPAVPALVKALEDPEELVRMRAASTLGEIGPGATPAVTALITALEDPDLDVQERAADSLRKIGAAAVSALPALKKAGEKARAAQAAHRAWLEITEAARGGKRPFLGAYVEQIE